MTLARSRLGRARLAVAATFTVAGLVTGLWAAHLPLLQLGLDLRHEQLGLVLLFFAVGAILAMPLTGGLVGRLGGDRCTRWAAMLTSLLLAVPLIMPNALVLALVILVFGATMGTMDIAMNVEAASVERQWHRPLMSSFHAAYSIGGLLGAGLGAVLLWLPGPAEIDLALAALALAGIALWAGRGLLPAESSQSGPSFVLPSGVAIGLGLACLAIMMAEGAILDWSAVHLRGSLGASPSLAAMGFAAFSATMTVGRVMGDRVIHRFGARRVLSVSVVLSATGLALAALAPAALLSAIGFGIAGGGLANGVPILFSTGARLPNLPAGTGIAMVGTLGYAGFLLGPPLIGGLAGLTSLPLALLVLVPSTLLAGLARRVVP